MKCDSFISVRDCICWVSKAVFCGIEKESGGGLVGLKLLLQEAGIRAEPQSWVSCEITPGAHVPRYPSDLPC